ncbi:MAG: hypothetical protein ABJC51_02065 [Acidobacteriota bacterium]
MKAAAALLTGCVLTLAWICGDGPAGWVYLVLYLLAVAPGIPLGIALFGRRHAAAWIGGALVGYGLTQIALWAVIAAKAASPLAFVAAWLMLAVASWAVARSVTRACGGAPAAGMHAWSSADTRALLLVLLIVPALMGPPYRNIGRTDAAGNKYYRAYFTADFLWHTALASELGKFTLPPRNPYLAPRTMNYYWTYFLLPSTVAAAGPLFAQDVQACLKTNAFLSALLMVGILFVLVRTAVASAGPAALAVILGILAASAEGLYALVDLLGRGRPLIALTDMNIDAITAWRYGGLRIDNIPRSLWYTPQHTTSMALGLAGLVVAATAGASASLPAIAGAGIALGLATTMNPLLGGVCSIVYGITVSLDALHEPGGWKWLPRHLVAALPVAAAVVWGAASKVMEGAGSALDFGFAGFARNHPVLTLLLSIGPLLIPAVAGIWPLRSANRRAWTIGTAGLVVGLLMLYLVRISDASWVGFRAGQVILVCLPVLLAPVLGRLSGGFRLSLAALILAIGLPTTAIDAWNAQDIGNRRPGPGFRWTIWITPDQQAAFDWIRENTPATALVQMEPVIRGRDQWTLIPSFAGRRMAAGLPISLLPMPEYQERSDRVKAIFETPRPAEASEAARRLRIDYLYVDDTDAAAYPEGVRKFDGQPALFEPVFTSGAVRIYRVR